jgi:hypothetical protein
MSIPTPKVEIGFDLTDSPIGPFFVLDDNTRGRLDNTEYRLGGTIFVDVTDRVRTISLNRGKQRRFANFQAGQLQVEFNNHDRAFDPLYPDSPFAGNIIPRREVKVTLGTAVQFTGWIDDWDLSYSPDGNSLAGAVATDAFTILANQSLTAGTPTEERTDERIATSLSDPNVNWATSLRDLEEGTVDVGTQEIATNTNALTYMQKVTETESGLFFIGKDGSVTFRNRVQAPTSTGLVTFDQGDNIPYAKIEIIYGAELLYNQVNIGNTGGTTQTVNDATSQGEYGIRELSITDLLGATDQQSLDLANNLLDNYADPEYRIEQLEVNLHDLDSADQETVLGLELGSVCQVKFTPNGIGDPIERFISVIKIDHRVTPDRHFVNFGFQEIKFLALVLDDAVFGKLDEGTLG